MDKEIIVEAEIIEDYTQSGVGSIEYEKKNALAFAKSTLYWVLMVIVAYVVSIYFIPVFWGLQGK